MEEVLGNLALPATEARRQLWGPRLPWGRLQEAVQALVALGYSTGGANKAVKQVEVSQRR